MKIIVITVLISISFLNPSIAQIITNSGVKVLVFNNAQMTINSINNSGIGAYLYFDNQITLSKNWINDSNSNFEQGPNGSVIFKGNTQQLIQSGGRSFGKVVLDNNSGLDKGIIINDNLVISDSLILLNGIISSYDTTLKIILETTANCNEGNQLSFADCMMQKISCTSSGIVLPTGNVRQKDIGFGTQTYSIWAPIGLFPSTTSTVSAKYSFADVDHNLYQPPIIHASEMENWLVSSSSNTTVILHWKNNNPCEIHGLCEINTAIFHPENLSVTYWDNIWIDAGGFSSLDYQNGSIESGIIPFNGSEEKLVTFGSKNVNVPLPIGLISFKGTCFENNVKLSWQTASESNNSHFIIEASENLVDFIQVGFMQSVGSSNNINEYTFNYINEYNLIYYRLIQVDLDGTETPFPPIVVNCVDDKNASSFLVSPNPFSNNINVQIINPELNSALIRILDQVGKIIYEENLNLTNGTNTFSLDTHNINSGSYHLQLITSKDIINTKIIKN